MRMLLRLIFNRWVIGAVALSAIALLIWWVGPTVAVSNMYPLQSEAARWANIAGVVLFPVGRMIWKLIKTRQANAILTGGLLKPAPAPAARPDASSEEVSQLGQRFESALGLLRKQHFGSEKPSLAARLRSFGSRQYLYDLPWYVFIGAPGSGKTTALLNSGLRFPLADRLGKGAVRGVGGTRNCDWWFTDEAVFLDTAGRYTTQQSDRDVDAAAWKGFLQLLKKTRPRRPINGVLLTISVADLIQHSPAEAEVHAEALRARVQELYVDLGVRLPIYVLVTKSDLFAGFSEFFSALGKEERAQVWGFSLPLEGQGALDPAALTAELERLERRLWGWLPERLEEERDLGRRALIYGFPQQFAVVRDRLVRLIEATFAPSRFEVPTLLRGVYFTSGTQEGTPIDRVMVALSRQLGLERQLLPAQHATGRSYFLTRLLREVVFPEAGLAGIDFRWERRRRWLERGAVAAAAAALIATTAAWWISYSNNRVYLREVAARFEDVKKEVSAIRGGARSDLAALLPPLTSVRNLASALASADDSVPWSWRVGLYQGGKLEAASRAAYRRMLQDTFLPSLVSDLERQLGPGSPANLEDAYDALRAYVMLYDPKHFQQDTVWRWYETHGEQRLVGTGAAAAKEFRPHFDALYERGWVEPVVPRNETLVASVRTVVGRDPLPKRVYRRVRRDLRLDVRDFTIVDKAGSNAVLIFERRSGEAINRGVPALYTKDGYYRHFAGRVEQATLQLAEEETWVLGRTAGTLASVASSPAHAEAVRRLYLEDYRNIWQQFTTDITVVRERDLARTIEIARLLSTPQDSPLKALIKAIERETSLSVPPEGDPGLAGVVTGKAQEYAGRARKMLTPGGAAPLEKVLVDDHFEDIRRFVSGPGGPGPAPIDGVIQQLNDFYHMLVTARLAIDGGQPLPPAEPANKLRADTYRHPDPARSLLHDFVDSGMRQLADRTREKQMAELQTARTRIDAELRGQLAEYCLRAVGDRYPFVRTSTQDVTPEDFARLFGPGGVLDSFFQKHLAQYVDINARPWRFKDPAMGQSAALNEFQRAQVIRDVFFRGGGSLPSIQLELKPVEMDATINQFMLDVDGKLVRYAHGPQVPAKVQFPGPGGRSEVRVSLAPPASSGTAGVKFEGPWALFRMFDGVQIRETGQSERFLATINVEGRRTVFEVSTSSVRNPFRLPELSQFRCPVTL